MGKIMVVAEKAILHLGEHLTSKFHFCICICVYVYINIYSCAPSKVIFADIDI